MNRRAAVCAISAFAVSFLPSMSRAQQSHLSQTPMTSVMARLFSVTDISFSGSNGIEMPQAFDAPDGQDWFGSADIKFPGASLYNDPPILTETIPADAEDLGRRKISGSYRFDGNDAIKVAFFDADSTLRVSKSGTVSANGPEDVILLPFVARELAELSRQGYLIAIVSNQAGIPKNVSLKTADQALNYTISLIRQGGGEVNYYDFAEFRDDDRKPNAGMAYRLEKLLRETFGPNVYIDKEKSFMVGDSAYKKGDERPDGKPGTHFSNSDRLFAEKYGIDFIEPTDFFGWRQFGVDVFTKREEVERFLLEHP